MLLAEVWLVAYGSFVLDRYTNSKVQLALYSAHNDSCTGQHSLATLFLLYPYTAVPKITLSSIAKHTPGDNFIAFLPGVPVMVNITTHTGRGQRGPQWVSTCVLDCILYSQKNWRSNCLVNCCWNGPNYIWQIKIWQSTFLYVMMWSFIALFVGCVHAAFIYLLASCSQPSITGCDYCLLRLNSKERAMILDQLVMIVFNIWSAYVGKLN